MGWKPSVPGERPTLGNAVIDWCEYYLQVVDGPAVGEPLRFTDEQIRFILKLYEVDPGFDGRAIEGRTINNGRLIRRAVLSRPKGWGKAERLDARIPTPQGWTTVGDIRPGDELFGVDGEIIRCVAAQPVIVDRGYRVTLSDGTSSVFHGEHLFDVDVFVGGAMRVRKTLSVAEMREEGLVFPRPLTAGRTKAVNPGVARFALPQQPVLQLPEADLPVDPYLLGAWLGDGDSDCPRLTCGSEDLPHMLSQIEAAGVEYGEPTVTSTAWRVRFGRGWAMQALRGLNLLGDKHVPALYLRASIGQRLALLQGLMDTDGHIDKFGTAEFCTVRRALADGVAELVRTLGMRVSVRESDAVLNGRVVGTRYRLKFRPYADLPVVRLPRKAERLVERKRKPLPRVIKSIEPVEATPMRCITVSSPDGLYLTGESMWVTHNSPVVAALCIVEALGPVVMDGWDAEGQPVGKPWWTTGIKPKVQIVAVSEDQTANTWEPCLDMVRSSDALLDDYDVSPMETAILVPSGKIEAATSAGLSREGFRPVFTAMDQALALDTPIPTPSGWTTMGEIETGDYVYGSSGQPVRVSEAKPVSNEHDCYRVAFADGTDVIASAGHLWHSKRINWPKQYECVRTTEGMLDGYSYRVPVGEPLERPESDLPVDPYLLGYWLGDGTRAKCELSVGESDVPDVQAILADRGIPTHQRWYPRRDGVSPACNLSFSSASRANRPPQAVAIRGLDCFEDKHVPSDYLLGSVRQRTDLLRGLMDSDGCVTATGTCTFVNTNKGIAYAVVELLRSLGQVCSDPKWVADARYTGGGKYRVDFTPRGGLVPFNLRRKVKRVRQHRNSPQWITIRSITLVPRVPVRCIAVESDDHLFAAGVGCHMTHNTESWTESNGGWKLARTIRRNIAKVNGCSVETPNAFLPGEESVAEASWKAFEAQREGRSKSSGLLYDHREAPAETDPQELDSLRAGLRVSYGDSANDNGGWVNLDRIIAEYWDADTDPQDARRYFLNQLTHASDSWVSQVEWSRIKATYLEPGQEFNPVEPLKVRPLAPGDAITVGFDGSMGRVQGKADATALIGCRIYDGHLFTLGVWEGDMRDRTWTPPVAEVDATVDDVFRRYRVGAFYADPSGWVEHVAAWEKDHGRKLRVKCSVANPMMAWPKGKGVNVVEFVERLRHAIVVSGQRTPEGVLKPEVTHDGSLPLTRHVLNARMRPASRGYLIYKAYPESPQKIDAAYAAIMAYKARLDCVARGFGVRVNASSKGRMLVLG